MSLTQEQFKKAKDITSDPRVYVCAFLLAVGYHLITTGGVDAVLAALPDGSVRGLDLATASGLTHVPGLTAPEYLIGSPEHPTLGLLKLGGIWLSGACVIGTLGALHSCLKNKLG